MENSKNITILLSVVGIIALGYYFLRKSKPTIVEEQLAEFETDTVSKIEEQLAPVPTIEEQLQIDKCAGLGRGEREVCMGIQTPPVAAGIPIRTSPIRSGTRTSTGGRRG
jgi:hypothetical protein